MSAAAAAKEEEGGGGRGRREGGGVSEMAGLHNFSEREQKESQEKWKARKEGACYLYLALACFFFFNVIFPN